MHLHFLDLEIKVLSEIGHMLKGNMVYMFWAMENKVKYCSKTFKGGIFIFKHHLDVLDMILNHKPW